MIARDGAMSDDKRIPNPAEIQREVAEFLKSKYGDRIFIPPQPDLAGEEEAPRAEKRGVNQIRFDMKPEELESYLKQFVVGQDEAIEVLATKICTHFNRMRLEMESRLEELVGNIKPNILMIGPTGVGKTYMIRLIAKKIGVPFVKADATKFSETGYVGGDVEDLVRELVREAGGDIKLAEYGIIYLDEIDKIASSGYQYGPDVSRTGVQRNLLKLMEESEVELRKPHDLASQLEAAMEIQRTGRYEPKRINTKNILWVMSGAFTGLESIIRRRLNRQSVGFVSDRREKDRETEDSQAILRRVRSEDLIEFGFESEFVGRLPVVVVLNDLDADGLYRILKNPNSTVIQAKKRDFAAYGIELEFTDEALRRIAEKAYQEHTGARALVTVCEKTLLKYEKKLPSTHIRKLVVTPEMVDDPEAQLERLLTEEAIREFQRRFLASSGIAIAFTQEAVQYLRRLAKECGKGLREVCEELFKDYEYGLKLLGLQHFTVDVETAKRPKETLEELIKRSYARKEANPAG